MHRRYRGGYSRPFDRAGEVVIAENTPSFEAEWVAIVRSTADRLEGELVRTFPWAAEAPDYEIARRAIEQARNLAGRPGLRTGDSHFRFIRRTWRRLAAWWTGYEVDQAWAALHTASQALLGIESKKVSSHSWEIWPPRW